MIDHDMPKRHLAEGPIVGSYTNQSQMKYPPCFGCERLEERHALVFFLTIHMGWGGVGLYSRSFNLHTLVMHTP